jgi:hypothetical protein
MSTQQIALVILGVIVFGCFALIGFIAGGGMRRQRKWSASEDEHNPDNWK